MEKKLKVIPVEGNTLLGRKFTTMQEAQGKTIYSYRYSRVIDFGNEENSYMDECRIIEAQTASKLPGIPVVPESELRRKPRYRVTPVRIPGYHERYEIWEESDNQVCVFSNDQREMAYSICSYLNGREGVDVERLARLKFPPEKWTQYHRDNWVEGFKAAGGFTREDMYSAYSLGKLDSLNQHYGQKEIGLDYVFEKIQSRCSPLYSTVVVDIGDDGSVTVLKGE